MLNYKKGEIGESITWVVATVIIIVVLTIFIFASSVLADLQSITVKSGEVDVLYSSLRAKTNNAFKENELNKQKINDWIEEIEGKENKLGDSDTSFIGGS